MRSTSSGDVGWLREMLAPVRWAKKAVIAGWCLWSLVPAVANAQGVPLTCDAVHLPGLEQPEPLKIRQVPSSVPPDGAPSMMLTQRYEVMAGPLTYAQNQHVWQQVVYAHLNNGGGITTWNLQLDDERSFLDDFVNVACRIGSPVDEGLLRLPVHSSGGDDLGLEDRAETFHLGTATPLEIRFDNVLKSFPVHVLSVQALSLDRSVWAAVPAVSLGCVGESTENLKIGPAANGCISLTAVPSIARALRNTMTGSDGDGGTTVEVTVSYEIVPGVTKTQVFDVHVLFEPTMFELLCMLVGGALVGSLLPVGVANSTLVARLWQGQLTAAALDLIAVGLEAGHTHLTLFTIEMYPWHLVPSGLIGLAAGLSGPAILRRWSP